MCRDSLVKALPSAMSRIRRHAGDGSLAYYGPGESGHWAVQMNQQVAAALAVLADTPEAELAAAGLSARDLSDTALALFRYSLRTHATGDLACTDGRKWGRTWISVLGLERSVAGELLLEPRFTAEDLARLKALLVDESRFRLEKYPIKAGIFKDNVPESNLWNGSVMFRTAWSYPDLQDCGALIGKASKLMLNGLTSPADAHESWFVGANFSGNWALDHHGYLNVGYMYECLSNLAFLYFDCLERGRKVPPELMHNAEDLWRVCKRLTFPDGRICRIGGDTRSRRTYCQLFAMQGWLFAAHAFKDEDAIRFEREYLAKIVAEQSANADGSYFGTRLGNVRDSSFYYYSRLEADALLAVASSLHWHRRHKFPSAAGCVDASRVEAWRDEGEHAIFLRGPKSFRSAAFRSQAGFEQRGRMPNVVCAPTDHSDLAEWSANLVGKIGLQIENDGWDGAPDAWPKGAVCERFYRDAGGEAFEQVLSTPVEDGAAIGEGEHGDSLATRKMEIHAVGDGTTMAIRDRVEISRVVQLEHGWSAGRLVVPAPPPGSGRERVYAGLGTRCATVDDALSIISVNGAAISIRRGVDIAFNRPGAQRLMHPLMSDKADELRVASFDGPMLAEPKSTLYDAVYIVVAGADAAAARKVAESAAWDGTRLVFTGTDGMRRTLELDFVPGSDEGRYDPKTVSRRITEQFLTVPPDDYLPVGYSAPGWLAKGYGWKQRIFYATASLWATALDNARQFGERDLEGRLVSAFEPYLGEKAWMLAPKFHVDFNVVGAVPLAVARLSGDERARKIGLELADFQWSEPTEKTEIVMKYATLDECRARWKDGYSGETRLWIDDMYMINLLQTEAYKLTGDAKYVRRAAREMCLYLDELQRPDGLFNHAPDVPFAWGRGAGWMAAGMPLVLSQMKQGDEFYDCILAGYRKMMDRLLECQRGDGMWGQLVDDPGAWSETSGSAMFAYAIAMGVERGWLEGDKWRRSVRRAWCALCDRLDGFGNISDVCVGTNKKNDRAYYLARGRANGDPHGQAPMLWLAGVLGRIDGFGEWCERTATGVRLVRGGRTVWNFEIDTPEGRPFIHPTLLPSGAPLTDLRPADHVWHLGCWFSWKYINGVNYWEPADERRKGCEPEGRTRVVKKSTACDGAACKVSLDLAYGPRAGGEAVLDEARTVEFDPPDANGGYAVTFRHRFTAREDVTLARTPPHGSTATGKWGGGYAGFTLRLDPAAAKSFEVLGSLGGTTPAAVTGVERTSLELVNPANGEGVTLTQLAGPDTARFYVWPDKRMVNPSPLYAGQVTLKKGETLDLAYRLVVHGAKGDGIGTAARELIESRVAAACGEIEARQATLADACSLADYRRFVRSVCGTNIWTSALQRALDEHEIVRIPASDEKYFLDGTVVVPSNRRIEAAGATIRLVDGTRTVMLRNASAQDGTLAPIPASARRDSNIAVVGGRWEDCCTRRAGYGLSGMFNLLPRRKGNFFGVSAMFFFNNASHVSVSGATFRHAGGFAVQAGGADALAFRDIVFDRCFADGLHLNGNLTRVLARNVRGQVGDDLVALNAYDWLNSSVNFGPQRWILCEDLELTRLPGVRAYPAIRILPAKYRYADGSVVDCSISDVIFRRVKGVTTYKMYLQTPRYAIGSTPEWGEVGSGGNLFFSDLEIDLDAPIDMIGQYATQEAPRGHFAAFEFGANLSDVHLRNVDVTLHAGRWPLSHLVQVGPKSCLLPGADGKDGVEVFDPYVSCRVGRVVLEDVRVHGEVPGELVHAAAFDDVNRDGRSTGRGEIGEIVRR